MSKSKVILPQLTDDEVEKLYTYFTKFDKNYSKFKGSKREYIVYVIGIVQSKKKTKKMEGGAPKAKPAGKAAAAAAASSLSVLPDRILYGIIEEVVTSLDETMHRLIDIPVEGILEQIMRETGYTEKSTEERKPIDKELREIKREETIRIAGPVGEEIALNFLKKHEKFKNIVRIPQPARDIEPILDLKGIPKDSKEPSTLFEIKNKVHGSNDVGIQHTKIMAALYLMSNANTQYKKTLPIVVFIRGNPRGTTRREKADVGEVFDLVRILQKEGLGKEILPPAEKTEFQKLFNTANAVDMAPGKSDEWKNKTDQIITALKNKGYGSYTVDPSTKNKIFQFDISPGGKLSTEGELEQIYSRLFVPPAEIRGETAEEKAANRRQLELDTIKDTLDKLSSSYDPRATALGMKTAQEAIIREAAAKLGMSFENYNKIIKEQAEEKRLESERVTQAAAQLRKEQAAAAKAAAAAAKEEADRKALADLPARPDAISINTMTPESKTEFAKNAASNIITKINGYRKSNKKKWNEEQQALQKMKQVVEKVDEGVKLRDRDIGVVLIYYYNEFPTDFTKFISDNNITDIVPYIQNANKQFEENKIQTAAHAALANELADNYMKLDLDLGLGYTEYANEMLKKGTIMSPEMHTISVKKKEIFDKLEGTTDPKQKGLLKMGMKLLPILEDRLIEKDKHFVPMFIEQLKDTRTDIEYNKLLSDIIKLSHTIALRKLPKDQWIDQSNPGLFKKYEEIIEIPMYVGLNYPTGADSEIKIKKLRDNVSDEAEKLLPYLMDLGNPDTKNILNKKLKKIKSEVHEVFPEYEVPEAEDESIEKLEKRLEFNRRRQELSERAEAAAQEEKDPEIQKELMIISENLLNDDTTEAQYEEDFALFNKLIGLEKKTTGKGMFGSGKKMLCRFSSGLGIY